MNDNSSGNEYLRCVFQSPLKSEMLTDTERKLTKCLLGKVMAEITF